MSPFDVAVYSDGRLKGLTKACPELVEGSHLKRYWEVLRGLVRRSRGEGAGYARTAKFTVFTSATGFETLRGG